LPLLRPTDTYDLDPFVPSGYAWDPPSTGASITGFSLSLAGLVSCVFMPLLTAPLAAAGIAVSATALLRCRRGLAGGRRWAMAGLVLGILGIAVILSLFVFFVSLAASGDRGP
jgi:hypothetical protein